MMLSYAQNMEDYHIAQAFAGQARGIYVDIGGGHPVGDNVTFDRYLAGWRGLVVEPQRPLAAMYGTVRPRDRVETCLVGRAPGTAAFHVVDRLHGFSTMVEANARGAADFGAAYQTEERPVETLAALADRHGLTAIDVLKIDVEGAEADVIAGNDWRRLRPRLVIVEAVQPGTMDDASANFEPLILEAGYRFVFFEGLNRFYVAEEAAELADRLPRAQSDWGLVRHLYEFGRAPDNADHPDHRLARRIAALPGRLAWEGLSSLDPGPLAAALGAVDDQPFRAALGRIAAPYDGGLMLE
jgi:FkbM family methyltransferase